MPDVFRYIKLIKGPTAGTLVGTDSFGNRYYENNNLDYSESGFNIQTPSLNFGNVAHTHKAAVAVAPTASARRQLEYRMY